MSGAGVNLFAWMRSVHSDGRLTFAHKLVASHLVTYADRANAECFPAVDTIASGVGANEKSVRRALENLEKTGWLVRQRTNRRQSYTYRLAQGAVALAAQMSAPELSRPDIGDIEAEPRPDTCVRSNSSRPDTDVHSKAARPDIRVRFDRTRVSTDLIRDPKNPPYPPRPATSDPSKRLSERTPVARDDKAWTDWASAHRRRHGRPAPTTTVIVGGRRCDGWAFEADLLDLPPIPSGYRLPYLEAAE